MLGADLLLLLRPCFRFRLPLKLCTGDLVGVRRLLIRNTPAPAGEQVRVYWIFHRNGTCG